MVIPSPWIGAMVIQTIGIFPVNMSTKTGHHARRPQVIWPPVRMLAHSQAIRRFFLHAMQIHTECSYICAWQPSHLHALTKMDTIHESSAGPGSWQILVPRVVQFATTTGLSAALVCCLFAVVIAVLMYRLCSCVLSIVIADV